LVLGFISSSPATTREQGGIIFSMAAIEDANNNYGVDILTGLMTWRLLFLDGDIKVEMVLLLWDNFSGLFFILLWLDLATMKN